MFEATKAEMAGNADWVIDADLHNLKTGTTLTSGRTQSNSQKMTTPTQFNITVPTSEIYWDSALSYWAIDLLDQTGELISNGEIIDSKIDVKKLNAGVYYLVIKSDANSETLGLSITKKRPPIRDFLYF